MNIEELIRDSKKNIGYTWNMDGYHESAYGAAFAVYTTPTKAYKMVITERAIWANEIAILEVSGDLKKAVKNFQIMIENSMREYETYEPIKVDWERM